LQQVAQRAYHRKGEGPLSAENFGDPAAAADGGFEVAAGQTLLLHHEQDRGDGVGRRDRMMFCLVGLDQDRKNLRLITFGRARFGIPQVLDLGQRSAVIGL
jgi:hypothetical protein